MIRYLVVQAREHPSTLDAYSYEGVTRIITYYNGKHRQVVVLLRVEAPGLTEQRLNRLAQDQAERLRTSLAGVEVSASFDDAFAAWAAWVQYHESSFLKRNGAA